MASTIFLSKIASPPYYLSMIRASERTSTASARLHPSALHLAQPSHAPEQEPGEKRTTRRGSGHRFRSPEMDKKKATTSPALPQSSSRDEKKGKNDLWWWRVPLSVSSRSSGLIVGVSDVDSARWPGSKWKCLLDFPLGD